MSSLEQSSTQRSTESHSHILFAVPAELTHNLPAQLRVLNAVQSAKNMPDEASAIVLDTCSYARRDIRQLLSRVRASERMLVVRWRRHVIPTMLTHWWDTEKVVGKLGDWVSRSFEGRNSITVLSLTASRTLMWIRNYSDHFRWEYRMREFFSQRFPGKKVCFICAYFESELHSPRITRKIYVPALIDFLLGVHEHVLLCTEREPVAGKEAITFLEGVRDSIARRLLKRWHKARRSTPDTVIERSCDTIPSLSPLMQTRLEFLLNKNTEGPLSPEEEQELRASLQRCEALTIEKARRLAGLEFEGNEHRSR